MTKMCFNELDHLWIRLLSPVRCQAIIWTWDEYSRNCLSLNQYGLVVNWTSGNKLRWNFNAIIKPKFCEHLFSIENEVCEMLTISSWSQCVNAPAAVSVLIASWFHRHGNDTRYSSGAGLMFNTQCTLKSKPPSGTGNVSCAHLSHRVILTLGKGVQGTSLLLIKWI